MKPRQLIQNFAYTGELVNTTIVEWIDENRQGDARNATPEDLISIKDKPAAGYLAEIEAVKAAAAEELEKQIAAHKEQVDKIHASYAAGVAELRAEIAALKSAARPESSADGAA